MNLPWLTPLQEATREARQKANAAMSRVRMLGQVFQCVDPRCSRPVYGDVPYKSHRVLGGSVDERNSAAVVNRLRRDAALACRWNKRQLVICETHTDCKYRELYGLTEEDVWANFQRSCVGLPHTVLVWVSRDVDTGTITIHGTRGRSVPTAAWEKMAVSSINDRALWHLLGQAGFSGNDLLHDLAHCLRGNLGRSRQVVQVPDRVGIVVGSGFAGTPSHFGISDRVERLSDALQLAMRVLREKQGSVPYVAVVIPRHPQRIRTKAQAYATALAELKVGVTRELQQLRVRCPVLTFFATKCTGDLHLAKI